MAIPEAQLTTWAGQGSLTQSKNTYASVKGVLENGNSPYFQRSFVSFLQGSYGNDTNIYADSDVDVVLRLDSTFQYDVEQLSPVAKASFDTAFPNEPYGYSDFKSEVISWLQTNYGASVHAGKKAIRIDGNGNRRDADVLPCLQHRTYHSFTSFGDQSYTDGITFNLPDGTKVVNYPKQHSENLTLKHQNTFDVLKPTVRIIKNMRNRMIEDGAIEDGLAPSYFIEGMLTNVPNATFNFLSNQQTVLQALVWLAKADKDKLLCANGIHYLVRPGYVECWDPSKFETFIIKALDYWVAW